MTHRTLTTIAPSLFTVLLAVPLASDPQGCGAGRRTEDAVLAAADGSQADLFGTSVCISDDTAVVGAPNEGTPGAETGAAYVYVRGVTGWSQEAKLSAADPELDALFGTSVSLSGDTLAIGAPRVGSVDEGAVYVFVRNGTSWSQEARLTAADGAVNDYFGSSVCLSGDTLVVGCPLDDISPVGFQVGSAYLFQRSGTTWNELEDGKLVASDGQGGDQFGISVAIADDTIVVGAFGDDDAGFGAGAAYVFTRSGATWSEKAKLFPSDATASQLFGAAVALSGDTLLIGAYQDSEAGTESGAAYVFVGGGTSWSQQAKLMAMDAEAGDQFGTSVSLAGEAALVGALRDDTLVAQSGSAYVFVRNGTSWSPLAKLLAGGAVADDEMGGSVGLSQGTAVVGARLADAMGAQSGAAFVFDLPLALSTLRNAGANPRSYAAGSVQLGGTFTATVDRSLSGRATSVLFGFDTPVDVTLGAGQHLLCLDLGGSGEVFSGAGLAPATSVGAVDGFSLAVPDLPSLCGFTFSSQALEFTPAPFVLSNAFDHTVGP